MILLSSLQLLFMYLLRIRNLTVTLRIYVHLWNVNSVNRTQRFHTAFMRIVNVRVYLYIHFVSETYAGISNK